MSESFRQRLDDRLIGDGFSPIDASEIGRRAESAVNHEDPESIAERFVDGFMHPNLEHDAERLARGYLELRAKLDALMEAR